MLKYTLKIWLSSVVTAPLVMLILYRIIGQSHFQFMEFYGWLLFYGGILSVPAAFIFWGFATLMSTFVNFNFKVKKLVCSVLAILSIYLSFIIFDLLGEYSVAISSYLITTIASIWLFNSMIPGSTNHIELWRKANSRPLYSYLPGFTIVAICIKHTYASFHGFLTFETK